MGGREGGRGGRSTSSLRGDGEDAQLGAVVECAVCDHPDRRPQIQAADAGACNQRETKRGRERGSQSTVAMAAYYREEPTGKCELSDIGHRPAK